MTILQFRPKHKIENLLPEIQSYYAQPKSQILPETIAYLEDQVRSMQGQIEFAQLQMLYGLIYGLQDNQQKVRSRYQQAVQYADTFSIHVNFLNAFKYINDFEYESKVFQAIQGILDWGNLNELNFTLDIAMSLGYTETALSLLKQKQKSDIHFAEHHKMAFLEKLNQMGLNDEKTYALFCDLRKGLMQQQANTLAIQWANSEYDESLVFYWFISENDAELLFICQNICDEIMIDFEEKHQLNLNNLFVIIQAQEAYCV